MFCYIVEDKQTSLVTPSKTSVANSNNETETPEDTNKMAYAAKDSTFVTPMKRSVGKTDASLSPPPNNKNAKVAKTHLLGFDSESTDDYSVADIIMESNKGLIHYLRSYATYNRLSFTLAFQNSISSKNGVSKLKSHQNNKNNIANQIDIVVERIIAAKEVILPNFEGDYSYLYGVGPEYSCLIHAYFLTYPGYEFEKKFGKNKK